MKKFNELMLLTENEKLINLLKIKEKIILINSKIEKLEKINKNNKNVKIYPITFEKEIYERENIIFEKIIKKSINKIKCLIIDTDEPKYATPFQNFKLYDFIEILKNDIENTINLLKNAINLDNELSVIIIIHRGKYTKSIFFTIKECINKFIIELMNNLNENNKKIKINCISTENINLDYKKKLYPFKKKHNYKQIKCLIDAYEFISVKNIKNKIIII